MKPKTAIHKFLTWNQKVDALNKVNKQFDVWTKASVEELYGIPKGKFYDVISQDDISEWVKLDRILRGRPVVNNSFQTKENDMTEDDYSINFNLRYRYSEVFKELPPSAHRQFDGRYDWEGKNILIKYTTE